MIYFLSGYRYNSEALVWDLSFDVNEQLMIMVQTTNKVKERARPYLQQRLVNVTRPDKWSHNNLLSYLQVQFTITFNCYNTVADM